MAIPRVSHYNWERLRGVTQIDIGTMRVDAEELSFDKRLDVVLPPKDVEGAGMRDMVNKFKFGGMDASTYSHEDWERGVEIEVDLDGQERAHRPHVPEELVERLEAAVKREYPSVPVESYSFDDLLGLYLDRKVEYLEYLDCELVGYENDS